ncbi:RNA polymerase sigma factor [Methylosarcina fibrata]|uniref:RNA polymerase sigma factor n=1 Tax=Methylosarcina fibrata TaxID=105972 RepID=UPI0003A78A0D|nr:sigma-70 family RNA polymerase sigma factor [Methylosarcina fibrata]
MNGLPGKPLNTENKTDQPNQDADLIARICQADEQAFELLYHRFYSRLFRFIARITRRTDMIDEVINDVMYVVWEKAETYNGQCQVSTWILGIAYNKARQTLRNHRPFAEESLDDMEVEKLYPAAVAQNDTVAAQTELENWLESALDRLSAEQRAVIELTYYHGLHYSEIAELMDCPENTVKTRMHHARKKLALVLKEQ